MNDIPPSLRSRALHLRWESPVREEAQAAEALRKLAGEFTIKQCTEAWRAAAVLDGAAFELAEAWFASRGASPSPTEGELELLCPGFLPDDYTMAIHNNILWARK